MKATSQTILFFALILVGCYTQGMSQDGKPVLPENFRIAGQSTSSISLAWDNPAVADEDAVYYTLLHRRRRTKFFDDSWTVITPLDRASSGYTVTNLMDCGKYEFMLYATDMNASGGASYGTTSWHAASSWTPMIRSHTHPTHAPETPTNFKISQLNYTPRVFRGEYSISWEAEHDYDFVLQYKPAAAAAWLPIPELDADGPLDNRECGFADTIGGTTYDFRIRAENSLGVSDWASITYTTVRASNLVNSVFADRSDTEYALHTFNVPANVTGINIGISVLPGSEGARIGLEVKKPGRRSFYLPVFHSGFHVYGEYSPDFEVSGEDSVTLSLTGDDVQPGHYTIFVNTGSAGRTYRIAATYSLRSSRDYNGDGRADIIWRDRNTHKLNIWPMNGSALIGEPIITHPPGFWSPDPGQWRIRGISVQGGGDNYNMGFLGRNADTHRPYFSTKSGGSAIQSVPQQPGPEWRIVAVGDFYNSIIEAHPTIRSKSDILWQHRTTHQLVLYRMMNVTRLSSDTIYPNPGGMYRIIGASDFNGDGKSDILFQHRNTRQFVIWMMDGHIRLASHNLSPIPPADWETLDVADYYNDGGATILFRNVNSHKLAMWRYHFDGPTYIGSEIVNQIATPLLDIQPDRRP